VYEFILHQTSTGERLKWVRIPLCSPVPEMIMLAFALTSCKTRPVFFCSVLQCVAVRCSVYSRIDFLRENGCMNAFIYMLIQICTDVLIRKHLNTFMCIHVWVCMWIYIFIYVYVYYTYIYTYIHTYIHIYLYTHIVCIYVHLYTHIYAISTRICTGFTVYRNNTPVTHTTWEKNLSGPQYFFIWRTPCRSF